MEEKIKAPEIEMTRKAKTAAEIDFLLENLAEHVLFEEVPLDRLNEVAHSMSECEIAAGDRLIEQGRKNDHFFIVNKGEFKLYKDADDGRGQQLFGRCDCLLYTSPSPRDS